MNIVLQKHQYHCPNCKKELDKEIIDKNETYYHLYILHCTCGYKYAASGEYFSDIGS